MRKEKSLGLDDKNLHCRFFFPVSQTRWQYFSPPNLRPNKKYDENLFKWRKVVLRFISIPSKKHIEHDYKVRWMKNLTSKKRNLFLILMKCNWWWCCDTYPATSFLSSSLISTWSIWFLSFEGNVGAAGNELNLAHSFLWSHQWRRWHSLSQYWTCLHFEHFLSGFSSPQVLQKEFTSWNPRCPLIACFRTSSAVKLFSLLASCLTTCWKIVHSLNGNSRTHSRIVSSM